MTAPAEAERRAGVRPAVAAALDAASILAFAVVGQVSHGGVDADVLLVAAPFLAAGALGHLLVRRRRDRVWPGGVAVWLVTWAGGMAVRALLNDGVAGAFVLVGLGALGVLMLGWRAVAGLARRRG
ncbi:DUF3054 domain-containing protein [Georgenia faecalis]|uniref:DUF3054 domain-containing protein n=1 Tax=Georgenia faecalis TaxID=2483799 RepID=UPI000FDC2478|nr:DUF3054 domain-containing protein [Georgenia faecalis]